MRRIAIVLGLAAITALPGAALAQDPNTADHPSCDERPGGSRTVRTDGFVRGLHVVSSNLPGGTYAKDPSDPNGLADRNIECAHFDDRTSGGTVIIPWRQFDRGPDAKNRYRWGFVEDQIRPWAERGQVVNLLVWPASQKESQLFPNGRSATPQYVLRTGATFQCPDGTTQDNGSSGKFKIPKFWEARVRDRYQEALTAFAARYDGDPRVNYFRFGIGVGAESYPANGTTGPDNFCRENFVALFPGDTDAQRANRAFNTWRTHALGMVRFFRELDTETPIVVTLNDFRTRSTQGVNKFPNDVAREATRNHHGYPRLGLGVQGATTADVDRWNAKPRKRCNANWCKLFNDQKTANIPLQLQTPNHSGVNGRPGESDACPDTRNDGPAGCMTTGNLAVLMDFARARGANSFELYPYEWYVVNDTAFRFHGTNRDQYRGAMDRAKN